MAEQPHHLPTTPGHRDIRVTRHYLPAAPLWQRAPTRDADGRLLADFMMLIPGLKHQEGRQVEAIIERIEWVLTYYQDDIRFADINLRLGILWISLRFRTGIILEIAAAVQQCVPQARLVSQRTG
jgi:hypothetical protein